MSSEADELRYSLDILGPRATGFEPSLYCFQHATDLGKLGTRLLRQLGFFCGRVCMAMVLNGTGFFHRQFLESWHPIFLTFLVHSP